MGWTVAAIVYAIASTMAAEIAFEECSGKWGWRHWSWVFGWPLIWTAALCIAARDEIAKLVRA